VAEKSASARIEHLALVGRLPQDAWPPPAGPQQAMPSGGLVSHGNVRNVLRDVRAGLLRLALRQFAYLARQRRRDVIVAVGDVYCLAVCLAFARRPAVFVATAKSQYVTPHSKLECLIARRARMTFARDAATAAALVRCGVAAKWAGNAMMDGLEDNGLEPPLRADAINIGVLPGSRADAPENLSRSVRRLRKIAALLGPRGKRVQALVSLAPSADTARMIAALAEQGLAVLPAQPQTGIVAQAEEDGLSVLAVKGRFGWLLRRSDIVLGQAGTGNEQAAGLGRPVIAALEAGESPAKVGWYRMRQQRLLGDALLVAPRDDDRFALETVRLLDDAARRERMAQAGRERMGPPGAAPLIADAVLQIAQRR
jgi:uncharacterized protein (TIGR03492 family)